MKNRQVCICTKHIDFHHHFLQDMMEEKDIYIQYNRSEDNSEDIMKENTSESDFARRIKVITEGELQELVDTGRENIKRT